MKTIRQLRTEATNDTHSDSNLLKGLVRSGLYEENKLTLLRRALNEDTKLTNVERKTLQELAEKLIRTVNENEILGENYQEITEEQLNEAVGKVSDFSKMPPILVLKRRAIRVFGGGQQVAMYWSDVLNRYIAIPFDQQPIMTEAVTWAQKVGYERALVAAFKENDPAAKAQLQTILDSQKARIIQQYGQKKFDKMHQTIVDRLRKPKESTKRAKKLVKKAQAVIDSKSANPIENLQNAFRASHDPFIAAGAATAKTIKDFITKPQTANLQKKVNRVRATITNRQMMSKIKENFQSKLKVLREENWTPSLDDIDMAMNLASFWGPASVPMALGSMGIHVLQGRWEELPWDVVGALPEVGPTIKAARRAKKIADIAGDISDAATRKSEQPTAQTSNTQEPPVKPKEQETVEQRKKREEEETAAKKNEKNIRNARGLGSDSPFLPFQNLNTNNQAVADQIDQKPQTGFVNPISGIAPTRTGSNSVMAARIASARRAALSEQSLNELNTSRWNKFLARMRRRFNNNNINLGGYYGGQSASAGDDYQYKKQRPQTGFGNPLESQNPFARARQGSPYDIYDVLSRQMTQANLAFMRSSIKEDTVLPKLYNMIQENTDTKNINIGNDSVLVTKNMASNIIKLFESINESNKVKLNNMLNESTDNFYKVLDFAVRH